MEAAHDAASLRASARLGVAEMIRGGTTSALTMETVSHTEEVFRVVEESGFRATVGKCMMDKGDEVPAGYREETEDSIRESLALLEKWHGRADGRVRYCFAPRFAVSCTRELLERVASLARERGVMIHTHASENRSEIELVERETGMRNVVYLDSLGVSGAARPARALRPSGRRRDGAARVEGDARRALPFVEPEARLGRRARHGDAGRAASPSRSARTARRATTASTCSRRCARRRSCRRSAAARTRCPPRACCGWRRTDGARALGLEGEVGSLEVGKRADVTVVELGRLHTTPRPKSSRRIVYAAEARDVRDVLIDGRVVLRDGELQTLDEREVVAEATRQYELLAARSGI